jgi:hypothetical protein
MTGIAVSQINQNENLNRNQHHLLRNKETQKYAMAGKTQLIQEMTTVCVLCSHLHCLSNEVRKPTSCAAADT